MLIQLCLLTLALAMLTPSTRSPTNAPSSRMPSEAPTSRPTLAPSSTPTLAPSLAPSLVPTTRVPTQNISLCDRNLTLVEIADMMSNNVSSCPVIIDDYSGNKRVYEMSNFASIHPHGPLDIQLFCGKDVTAVFTAGSHRYLPFMGDKGVVEGYNRSSLFTCLGSFVASSLAPTPPTVAPPTVNASIYPCLSLGKEYQIRQVILNKFRSIPVSPHNEDRAAFNGGMVRLAFHDAGTYSRFTNDGGPDGCLNLADPDNAGLQHHTEMLEELWIPFKDRITRADFWFLAAIAAVENSGGPKIPFRYGRQDCTADNKLTNNPMGRLPAPNRDWTYVKGFFGAAMGFSDREITALMGAHVFGRAHANNSGFDGPWTSGTSPGLTFSNQFFLALQTVEWEKSKNNFTGFPNRFQWNQVDQGAGLQMFLTSDVVLLLKNADNANCTSSLIDQNAPVATALPKDPECLKNEATFPIVDEYSHFQANFFRDFAVAYQKLCELGYPSGALIPPGTCFPGALVFANDPPVPLPPTAADDTIGGMSPAGFGVLIAVLVLLLVAFTAASRHFYKKRAQQPLNDTEAELIRQSQAARRAKANPPAKPTERKSPLSSDPDPADAPPLPATLPKGVSALPMTDEPVS